MANIRGFQDAEAGRGGNRPAPSNDNAPYSMPFLSMLPTDHAL